MTAAFNDFVKEWSQHFKPNECKNINLEAIKLCNEKHNLEPTSLKLEFLPTLVGNGAQIEIRLFSIFFSATFWKTLRQDGYQGIMGKSSRG